MSFLNLIHSYFLGMLSLFQFFHEIIVFHNLCLGCFLIMQPFTFVLINIAPNRSISSLELCTVLLALVHQVLHFGKIEWDSLNLVIKIIVSIFVIFDFCF